MPKKIKLPTHGTESQSRQLNWVCWIDEIVKYASELRNEMSEFAPDSEATIEALQKDLAHIIAELTCLRVMIQPNKDC